MPKISHIWVFDENHRRYRRDQNGRAYGGPIYRDHWVKREVVAETSRSWILNCGTKIPKTGRRGVAFTEDEVNQDVYIKDNGHKIADKVRFCNHYETLREVARLVGFKEIEEQPK